MATIQLTGDFSEAVTTAGTEVADTRTITIRLLSTIILANNDIHAPQRWVLSLVSGAFTRYMVVPDVSTQAARYSIVLPDGPEVAFSLASTDGPIANLATILLTNLLTITPDALAVLLATYTPLTTYTAHTTAIGGAALGHVKNGGNVVIDGAGLMTAPASSGEPALGNPATSGYVLSSTTGGARSWIAPGGGGGGTTVTYGAWINLTLENSWSNYNTTPSGYRKITIGGVDTYVELRGEIYRVTFAASLTIATLPTGFRPPTNWRQQFKIFSSTGDGQIIVKPDGVIESYTGGTAMDLSNVRIYLV